MTQEPTIIRGHLAEVGSRAEAYLVAWGEVGDVSDLDVTIAWLDACDVLDAVAARRTSADLYTRESCGRGGYRWAEGQALRREAVQHAHALTERADLAGYLLLLAQDSPGYLGKEA